MTQLTIDTSQLEQIILQKLPTLIQESPQIQELILKLAQQNFADRQATEDRFYQLLNELRQDREEQAKKWEEQNRKWDDFKQELQRDREEQAKKWEEQNRKWDDFKQELQRDREEQAKKWDEQNRKWDEQNRKWDEQNRKWDDFKQELQRNREEQAKKWDEQGRKWDEQNQKWDEQNRKWEDAKLEFARMHEAIMAIAQKQERSIGALGARWGIQAESSFRNALAGILEKSFGVEVVNVNEYDDQGEVFGRPDQIELDVIIKNGLLIICEIKSSIDKAGMYIFERKVRFYEKRHQRQANRLLVISPMVDSKAQTVADRLGIEVYSDSVDVKKL